jgi:putative glutamine amidotransferase
MVARPLVVIPGRFSASASAHRYAAISTARTLSENVLLAGGEPLTIQPWAPDGPPTSAEIAARLAFADAVLLPGGGDLAPTSYGQVGSSDEVYDVDEEQDTFDLAVARWALEDGVPLLAVCRGWQVVNVALGGELEQHMEKPHRHVVHTLSIADDSLLAQVIGASLEISCFHHQRVSRLGDGLEPLAVAEDGTVEAAHRPGSPGWFLGVQWHPEDTASTDPAQLALFRALVEAARRPAAQRDGGISRPRPA